MATKLDRFLHGAVVSNAGNAGIAADGIFEDDAMKAMAAPFS